ncbi:ABC transporter ATP-binding protein [Actinophytocola sp.]|uniref:ABC transporter ATP-binding protein n=1 Tax=Actinophytocola sp. TaxID=1872138 RepID=UPI002D80D25E|nr:ABC transporter ATP-binding protein [Actinophytocola sp.]HET9143969.1 ABC transporter ATP-binding protein [Actinophytocola sp.]
MLEIEDLTTTYGPVRAVDGVNLTVAPGAITAVLGANGAGKTTLLRTVSGLVRPRSGRIRMQGKDITRSPAELTVRGGLALVPEGGGVITELTVAENLRLGALWRGDRADRAHALREVCELFPPLEQRLSRPASTLSGGERQMLAIGRALMSRPRLLLLDEPSLGLAPMITARIMQVLRDLRASTGLTVLLVEQNARSALSIADDGVVLSLGQVVMTAPAEALLTDEALRHAYLGF